VGRGDSQLMPLSFGVIKPQVRDILMRHLCPGQEIIIGNARPARVTTTGQWRRQWQRHKHKPQEQQQQQWQRRSCKDNSTTCLTPWPTAYLFIFPG